MLFYFVEFFVIGFILILPFLYDTFDKFKYQLKFIFYYVMVGIVSGSLVPIFLFRPRNCRNLLISAFFLRYVSRVIGVKWVLRGKEILEQDRACIIVCNHQSSIDILGMFEIWHVMKKCTVIAKKELLLMIPFGQAAWLGGLIFIKNQNSKEGRKKVNEAAEEIKKDNIKLWVFPEGRRRCDGKIHDFKKGAFHMAVHAQLPILPIVFSQFYFIDAEKNKFDNGTVIVTVLDPISTEGLTSEDVGDLMTRTKKIMDETFLKTSCEVNTGKNWKMSE